MEDKEHSIRVYSMMAAAVKVLAAHGVRHAVLCPGSRSAPIALSFLRNKEIKSYILPDERSAGYTALGISRELNEPVALVSTSGTAALNFGPAAAEAYFSSVPLIILTADRPPEWIGQADNQAIFQDAIYGKHVKGSFTLPVDYSHADARWYAQRLLNEAMIESRSGMPGPVHINIPFREPLYLDPAEVIPVEIPKIITVSKPVNSISAEDIKHLLRFKKVLFVAGTLSSSEEMTAACSKISKAGGVLVTDVTSNLHNAAGAITLHDLILDKDSGLEKPDLVVSFGGPIISKNLKQFLRSSEIKEHWHIGFSPKAADTFQRLSRIIPADPADLLDAVARSGWTGDAAYAKQWTYMQSVMKDSVESKIDGLPFSEVKFIRELLTQLPENTTIHAGNSLPVRYLTVFGGIPETARVFSNRGTSGIDGSVSSAAGHSMAADNMHLLICGDLSFMYDRNGLWNNYLRPNLKIVVLNNHGGGIFRELPGPSAQKELDDYFVVKQPLRFRNTAEQHGFRYFHCDSEDSLAPIISDFISEKNHPSILEADFRKTLPISEVRKMLLP